MLDSSQTFLRILSRISLTSKPTDVAFDILYDGDGSVIHRPLRERQQLLQKSIRPLSGRLELLIPEAGGLNSKRAPGETVCLIVCHPYIRCRHPLSMCLCIGTVCRFQ